MSGVRRVTREPAAVLGVVTAATGLLVLFGIPLSVDQVGGILTLAGALMALTRVATTPDAKVVARETTKGQVVAGPASPVVDGHPVTVVPVDHDLT